MAYEIRKYDGTLLATVEDGLVDSTSASIKFIGKNTSNFGKIQNETFLHLLENFAASTEPTSPIAGQLWYNNSTKQLFLNTGSSFTLIGPNGSAATSGLSNNLNGGTTGSLPYQTASTSTAFLGIGSANTVLTSSGTAPQWTSQASLLVGKSTNISGGAAGSVPYQTAVDTTNFVSIGANGYILLSNGTAPVWASPSSITSGLATTATNAQLSTTQAVSDDSTKIATTQFVHNILPTGVILMWSGSIGSIPTGWHICDGTSGTPDLRNKFIVGAGDDYSVGNTGGASSVTPSINSNGSHDHTGITGQTVLTTEQMPEHAHTVDDIRWSEIGAAYTYNDPVLGPIPVGPGPGSNKGTDFDNGVYFMQHNTYKTGSSQGHDHSISTDGFHNHSANPIDTLPPYYALCYIMKIV